MTLYSTTLPTQTLGGLSQLASTGTPSTNAMPAYRPYGYVQVYGPIGVQVPPALYAQLSETVHVLPSYNLLLPYTAPVTIQNPIYDPTPVQIMGLGSPIDTTDTPLSPASLQSILPAQVQMMSQHLSAGIISGTLLYQPELYSVVAQIPVVNQYNPFTNSPPIVAYATPQTSMPSTLVGSGGLPAAAFTLSPTINTISNTLMQPASRLPEPAQQAVLQAEAALEPYYQTANTGLEAYGLHLPSYQEAAWYTVGLGQYPLYQPALQGAIAHSPLGNYFNPFSSSPSSPPDTPTPMSSLLNNLVSQVAGLGYQHLPLPPMMANLPVTTPSLFVPY